MAKEAIFTLCRDTYRGMTTLGKVLYPDNQTTNQTLEDVVRGWGIKDKKNTAIPVGRYRMSVTHSNKFGRRMVSIYTEPDKSTIKANGIQFSGVRAHGGTDHLDTEACIIVAKTRVNDQKVHGSCEAEFTAAVEYYEQRGYEVFLEIKNMPQKE